MGEPMTHGRSLQKLGRELAEELDATRDETVLASARERLFERRRASAPAARRVPLRTISIGFAFAAAVAAAFIGVRSHRSDAMSFQIGDSPASAAPGAWVAASGTAPVPLRFDDGSRFDVEPGARARVASSTLADARLVLESGTIHGDTAGHDKAGAWHVTAGPFDVAVRGTRFQISWDPASEQLDIRDITGRAVVTGPTVTEGVAVKSGQYLRVSVKQAKLEVSAVPLTPAAPSEAPTP
jgi:ferric-dicitrate binding protein FerR (iron transport regulator)